MQNESPESVTLRQQQLAFAASIRNPHIHNIIDGVTKERMAVYRDLFFNNFIDTLSSAFPVLHRVIPAKKWRQLCEDFFANFHCHTPYLSRVPYEFVRYLQQHETSHPIWLIELAQWEWTELDLLLSPDADTTSTGNNVLIDIPVMSPLARLHGFSYAVHHISIERVPVVPAEQMVHLLAWRKPNDVIGFMELNALSACLLALIRDNTRHSGQQLLLLVAAEFSEFDSAVIMQGGADALTSFYQNAIVLLRK